MGNAPGLGGFQDREGGTVELFVYIDRVLGRAVGCIEAHGLQAFVLARHEPVGPPSDRAAVSHGACTAQLVVIVDRVEGERGLQRLVKVAQR